MSENIKELRTFRAELLCDKCETVMTLVSRSFDTYKDTYNYECYNCSNKISNNKKYPYIKYIERDQDIECDEE